MLGAAAAAGVGLLSKDKKNQTVQTQQQGVPSWLEGPYKDYLAQLQKQTGQPFDPYTGQGVADLTQPSLQGVDLAQQRALNGAPDLNQARGMTMDVTGGKYLDNPYLSNNYTNQVIADNAGQMARSFAEGTAAQNDAGFNRAGAYGGSAWANKQSSDAEGLARQIGSHGEPVPARAHDARRGRLSQRHGADAHGRAVGRQSVAGRLARRSMRWVRPGTRCKTISSKRTILTISNICGSSNGRCRCCSCRVRDSDRLLTRSAIHLCSNRVLTRGWICAFR